MYVDHKCNDGDGGKLECSKKNYPSAAFSTTNLTFPAWDRTWASVATDHEFIFWAMAWLVFVFVCVKVVLWWWSLYVVMWTKQVALYLRFGFCVYKCYPWYLLQADCNYKHTDCYNYWHQWEWNQWLYDITHVCGSTTHYTLDCHNIRKVQNISVYQGKGGKGMGLGRSNILCHSFYITWLQCVAVCCFMWVIALLQWLY